MPERRATVHLENARIRRAICGAARTRLEETPLRPIGRWEARGDRDVLIGGLSQVLAEVYRHKRSGLWIVRKQGFMAMTESREEAKHMATVIASGGRVAR